MPKLRVEGYCFAKATADRLEVESGIRRTKRDSIMSMSRSRTAGAASGTDALQ
jgi:hypothetical protein